MFAVVNVLLEELVHFDISQFCLKLKIGGFNTFGRIKDPLAYLL